MTVAKILTKPEFLCEDYIRQITTPAQFAGLHLGIPARVRDMGNYGVAGYVIPQGYYVRWDTHRGAMDALAPFRDPQERPAGTRLPVRMVRHIPSGEAPPPTHGKMIPFRQRFPEEPGKNPRRRYRLVEMPKGWKILEMTSDLAPREVLGGGLADLPAARIACRELNQTGTVSQVEELESHTPAPRPQSKWLSWLPKKTQATANRGSFPFDPHKIPLPGWKLVFKGRPYTVQDASNAWVVVRNDETGTEMQLSRVEFNDAFAKGYARQAFGEAFGPAVNPRQAHVRLVTVWAFKGRLPHNCDKLCREREHYYRHNFVSEPYVYQMSDGALLVTAETRPPATVTKDGATKIYEKTDKIDVRLPDGRITTRRSTNNNSCILGLPGDNFMIEHFQ